MKFKRYISEKKSDINIDDILAIMKGADVPDNQFDPVQLKKGTEVEKEHFDNYELAKGIAKAHLLECSNYYIKLEELEKNCKKEEKKEE